MRWTILPAAAIALLAITGCSSEPAPKVKPQPEPATVVTESPSYDVYDCRALLERNYDDDTVHDASDEPECEALTHDEYIEAVKAVLTGRKDEILDTAANQDAWDEAWNQTNSGQQDIVCERLHDDGAVVVGKEMADSSGDDETEQINMARYLLKEKC